MSHVRIWIHLVFSTKNREPLLTENFRYHLFKHIAENCIEKNIFLQTINGYIDHIHCLISLGKDQNIAKVSQLIKGESSFWINKHNLTKEKFAWQDDILRYLLANRNLIQLLDILKIKRSITP